MEDSTVEVEILAGFGERLLMPDQATIDVSNVVVKVDPRLLVSLAIGKKALADQLGTFKLEVPAAFGQAQRHGLRPVTVRYEDTGRNV